MLETLSPSKLGKRKPIGESEDDESVPLTCSPSRVYLKRQRTASAEDQNLTPLTLPVYNSNQHAYKIFDAMPKTELISFIVQIMNQSPDTAQTIKNQLPTPSIETVSTILKQLERKLYDTFPYSKTGRDTSDYSYNRVRPVLLEINETCEFYLDYFTNLSNYSSTRAHEYPSNAFQYMDLAANFIHSLPVWQSDVHNQETKNQAYTKLSASWCRVIKLISAQFKEQYAGFGMITEWASVIKSHHSKLNGNFGFNQVLMEFEKEFGWIVHCFQ